MARSTFRKKKAGKLRVQKGNDEQAVTIASRERMHKGVQSQLLKLKPLTGRTHQLRYQCMVRKCQFWEIKHMVTLA